MKTRYKLTILFALMICGISAQALKLKDLSICGLRTISIKDSTYALFKKNGVHCFAKLNTSSSNDILEAKVVGYRDVKTLIIEYVKQSIIKCRNKQHKNLYSNFLMDFKEYSLSDCQFEIQKKKKLKFTLYYRDKKKSMPVVVSNFCKNLSNKVLLSDLKYYYKPQWMSTYLGYDLVVFYSKEAKFYIASIFKNNDYFDDEHGSVSEAEVIAFAPLENFMYEFAKKLGRNEITLELLKGNILKGIKKIKNKKQPQIDCKLDSMIALKEPFTFSSKDLFNSRGLFNNTQCCAVIDPVILNNICNSNN